MLPRGISEVSRFDCADVMVSGRFRNRHTMSMDHQGVGASGVLAWWQLGRVALVPTCRKGGDAVSRK